MSSLEFQNIPLGPVDRSHATRRHPPPIPLFNLARQWHILAAAAGLLAAVAGAMLGGGTPEFSVRADAGVYRIGSLSLPASGGDSYTGPAGAVVVLRKATEIESAGSTTIRGQHMIGHCIYVLGSDHESCLFVLGMATVTATDMRTPSGWVRRYSDDSVVRIDTGGRPTPIPFAIGR